MTVHAPLHATPAPIGPATLDGLAALTVDALDALYRRARPPASLDDLDGAPVGRMLSVRGLDRGAVHARLAAFAGSDAFPWRGKSFRADTAREGGGINRTSLLGDVFPFGLAYGASAIDGRPCVILDYDRPENPWFIRAIHDELRELRPGLFLGPAMWKGQGGEVLVLYFAIDAR